MNKLFVTGLMVLLLISPVMAQELAKPWLLPDNPFYPFQRVIERIQLMLTFDPEAKARLHLQFAERRLVELNETLVKNQTKYVEKLKIDYEDEMNETEKEVNVIQGLGRNVTVLAEHVSNVTYKHILVLERILEKVSDQAKPAIEHAINVSIRGHEQAVERILERINKTSEKVRRFNCTTDADCKHLFCPQVLGSDTPICEEGKCKCGAKWQIKCCPPCPIGAACAPCPPDWLPCTTTTTTTPILTTSTTTIKCCPPCPPDAACAPCPPGWPPCTTCKNDFDCPSQMKCENSICVDVGCVPEGGAIPGGSISPEYRKHMASICCSGLQTIPYSRYYDDNCNFVMKIVGGPSGVCSKCGNGICEKWETKCTCKEDCVVGQLNIDGDFSFSENQDIYYWNNHSYNLADDAIYNFTFNDHGEMAIQNSVNSEGNGGHIAMGVWWDRHFPNKEKFPLDGNNILIDFNVKVNYANANNWKEKEWLRIALASAFQDIDNKVWYTELDFYDSPKTDWTDDPETIFVGGNVKEYKFDQISVGEWKHYRFNLSEWVTKAWSQKVIGGKLESVYFVIELANANAKIEVDNLLITNKTSPCKEGERRCLGNGIEQCINGGWAALTTFCQYGCSNGKCITTTTTTTLPPPGIFGFNTHLYVSGTSNLKLATFKTNVDDIVANDKAWIRFSIPDWEVAPSGNPTTINWNTANLAVYDSAINYAKDRGLKILLVTNVPSFAKDFSFNDYRTTTQTYYQFLANRYNGKVDIWQIFNEVNVHNYTNYELISSLPQEYLNNLNTLILLAKNTIKNIDPNTKITTNVGGWPYNDQLQNQWIQFFDAESQNLDLLTLDIYPDKDTTIINSLQTRVNQIKNRYGKPVIIGEIGMCTGDGRFSESDQGYYVPLYIQNLKLTNPTAIFVYEIQDDSSKSGCEASFGIKYTNRSAKTSYSAIMQTNTIISFINASTPAIFGNYKIYATLGVNESWTQIEIKDIQNNFLARYIINPGESTDTIYDFKIKLLKVNALLDGTVLSASVEITSLR